MKKISKLIAIAVFITTIISMSSTVQAGPWGKALGGALLGTVIGGIAGGSHGAEAGFLIGGGTGLAVGVTKDVKKKKRAQKRRAQYEKERLEWEKMRVQAEMQNRREVNAVLERERLNFYNRRPNNANSAKDSSNISQRLTELENLRRQELITEYEYNTKRAEILKGL